MRARSCYNLLFALLAAITFFSVHAVPCDAATITEAEYYFDADPGAGNGTSLPPADGAYDSTEESIDVTGISTAGLKIGSHTLYLRFLSSDGIWGLARPVLFEDLFASPTNFTITGTKTLKAAEYFIDQDPGIGMGVQVSSEDGTFDSEEESLVLSNISISGLTPGMHNLYLRAKDSEGTWGVKRVYPFEVYVPALIVNAEYFIDTDPGPGKGTQLLPKDGSFNSVLEEVEKNISATGLTVGSHTLYVRFKDSLGRWGALASQSISAGRPVAYATSTPVQPATGDGRLPVNVQFADGAAGSTCKMAVEYALEGTTAWTRATILPGSITATYGQPALDNGSFYQIGTSAGWILANAGPNNISFVWSFVQDLGPVELAGVRLRFTASCGNDAQAASTESAAFSLDSIPPAMPELVYYTPDPTGDTTPTLDWKWVDRDVRYHLQVATDVAFTTLLLDQSDITADAFTPITPLQYGPVYWRVSAIDALGNEGYFSTVDTFSIVADSTPPSVALSYSRPQPVGAGLLTITAVFSEPLVSVPQIAIVAPGNAGIAATAMSGAGTTWTYAYTIHCTDASGIATVTITNGLDSANNINQPASNNTFTIDTSACGSNRITAAEYFFDIDPGEGRGITLPAADGAYDNTEESIDVTGISTAGLKIGSHTLYLRFLSSEGIWGLARPVLFEDIFASPTNFTVTGSKIIAAVEYFIDQDPGAGLGEQVFATDGTFDSEEESLELNNISISNLDPGMHNLYLRAQDSEGTWGIVRVYPFEVYVPALIAAAEYFIDTDPGQGKGIALAAKDGSFNSRQEDVDLAGISTAALSAGSHTLYVRYKDNLGRWGAFASQSISVGRPVAYAITTPVQPATGDGRLPVNVQFADGAAGSICKMAVEYALEGTTAWKRATIQGSITAAYGQPALDNGSFYQIGTAAGWILANTGPNNISFVWSFAQDLGPVELTGVRLRFTASCGNDAQAVSTESGAFALDSIPPAMPELVLYTPDPTGDTTPTLAWQWVDSAMRFHLQVAADVAFTTLRLNRTDITAYAFTPTAPLPYGRVYWRVSAIDALGNEGYYSTVDTFSIVADSTPPSVTLSYNRPQPVGAGPITITAHFSEPLISVPHIVINQPGTADLASTAMTGSGATWNYIWEVQCADGGANVDGTATVTITGGFDAAGNQNTPAQNATFTINTNACSTMKITAAEYYFDVDPGEGNGVSLPAADGAYDSTQESIDVTGISIAGLKIGSHTLYLRFLSSEGVWGMPRPALFENIFASPTNFTIIGTRTLAAAEYFIDQDPGAGMGVQVSAEDGAFDSDEETLALSNISISGFDPGMHNLYVRAQDSEGTWGVARVYPFEIYVPALIAGAEYLIDTDPGPGKGTALAAKDGSFNSRQEDVDVTGINIASLSMGSHTVYVRFKDNLGRWGATNSAGFNIISDPGAPDTFIINHPAAISNSISSSFTFTSDKVDVTFECWIDSGNYNPCISPASYSLSDGTHTFKVRAVNVLGIPDGSPAPYSWTIDTTPPETTITSRPPTLTNNTAAIFTFTSSESNSSFECKLDSAAYSSCAGSASYANLSNGAHVFTVRAIDQAGNIDSAPAIVTWEVAVPGQNAAVNLSMTAKDVLVSLTGNNRIFVDVFNNYNTAKDLSFGISGLDPSWYTISDKESNFTMPAFAVRRLTVQLHLPNDCNIITQSYPFTADVSWSHEGAFLSKSASGNLIITPNPNVFPLSINAETRLSGNRIFASWKTDIPTTSKIYYRKLGEQNFIEVPVATDSLEHRILLDNLEYFTYYEYKTESRSGCNGMAVSNLYRVKTGKAVKFKDNINEFWIDRDYNQHAAITITNSDTIPHTYQLTVINDNQDLAVDFVGTGSVNRTATLLPGDSKVVDLVLHAPDATKTCYDLYLKIVSDEAAASYFVDYSHAIVNVRPFVANLDIQPVQTMPGLMKAKYRLFNYGDTLTDIKVELDSVSALVARINPAVHHQRLARGEFVEFEIEAQRYISGILSASSGSYVVSAAVEIGCPVNTSLQTYTIQNVPVVSEIKDWYCTNKPELLLPFDVPRGISHPNLLSAMLEVRFSLPMDISSYDPHSVSFYINDKKIASLENTIPNGTFQFQFPSSLINLGIDGPAENRLKIVTEGVTEGQYIVVTDFRILMNVAEMQVDLCIPPPPQECPDCWTHQDTIISLITPTTKFRPGAVVPISVILHNNDRPGYDHSGRLVLVLKNNSANGAIAQEVLPQDVIVPGAGELRTYFTYTIPKYADDIDYSVEAYFENATLNNITPYTGGKDLFYVRSPLIIIHGVAGSKLKLRGDSLWGTDINFATSIFGDIALESYFVSKMMMKDNGDPIIDSITAYAPIKEVLKPIGVDTFDGIEKLLKTKKYIIHPVGSTKDYAIQNVVLSKDYKEDVFYFVYDWRLDNNQSAANLKSLVETIYQVNGDQANVIAHSMGGLVLKKLLSDDTSATSAKNRLKKVVFVGTPHIGAPKAFAGLAYGKNDFSINETLYKGLLMNMPSVYQLLPSAVYFSEQTVNSQTPGYYIQDENRYADYNSMRELLKGNYNSLLVDKAVDFHSAIDNLAKADLPDDAYAIFGCMKNTIKEVKKYNGQYVTYTTREGDGTVPQLSAKKIDVKKTYAAENVDHANLPSASGVKELIHSLLTGHEDVSFSGSAGRVAVNSDALCKQPDGIAITIPDFSWGSSSGNLNIWWCLDDPRCFVSFGGNGIVLGIRGSDYYISNTGPTIFVPEGAVYTLELKGVNPEYLQLKLALMRQGGLNKTYVFYKLPVSGLCNGIVEFDLKNYMTDPVMKLDCNGDGQYEVTGIGASYVLSPTMADDYLPPLTTANITGSGPVNGWYRSAVSISLNGTDETDGSGLLYTKYRIDSDPTFHDYNGTILLDQSGTHTITYYSVDKNLNTEMERTVEVKINKAPIALAGTISLLEDTTYAGSFSASDPENDPLVFKLASFAAKGTVTILNANNGEFQYVPSLNANGTDSFTFVVNDGLTDSTPATVSISITPVNDPPVISGSPSTSIVSGQTYSFTPSASDVDGYALVFSIANKPTWASFDTATGKLSGTPQASNIGTTDNIVISVSDGTVMVSLPAFNLMVTPNVALKPGDCDGDGNVSIAEVQSAINMYLGLKTTAACVDGDVNTSVSIAEVQKVINGYLGL